MGARASGGKWLSLCERGGAVEGGCCVRIPKRARDSPRASSFFPRLPTPPLRPAARTEVSSCTALRRCFFLSLVMKSQGIIGAGAKALRRVMNSGAASEAIVSSRTARRDGCTVVTSTGSSFVRRFHRCGTCSPGTGAAAAEEEDEEEDALIIGCRCRFSVSNTNEESPPSRIARPRAGRRALFTGRCACRHYENTKSAEVVGYARAGTRMHANEKRGC